MPWIAPEALEEQRRLLPESQFERLHLNRWTAPEDVLTTPEDVRRCMRHKGPLSPEPGRRYVIGVDVGILRDPTVGVVAHAERTDQATTVVIDRIESWTPRRRKPVDLAAVESWITEVWRSYNTPTVVLDPWQSMSTAQRLRYKGVEVVEYQFTQASVGRLALTLHRLLRDRLLDLPKEAGLAEELASIRLRETGPNVYRLDHNPDQHDDRAVAIGLAAHQLLSEAPPHVVFDPASIARAFGVAS